MYIQTLFTILCVGTTAVLGQALCSGHMYTVQAGDDCSKIGAANGVSAQQIIQANPWLNAGCTNLQSGAMICIPA